jgi:uncharacterized protein (DUF2062 family)
MHESVDARVFGGMIAAELFGIFVIPILYVVFQWLRERTMRSRARVSQERIGARQIHDTTRT